MPYDVAWIEMSSTAAFAAPSGTGPFKVQTHTPRKRTILMRKDAYWNPDRMPKLDAIKLIPVPDALARMVALRTGQVDWAKAPPSDALDCLTGAGFQMVSNVYPHVSPWHFSMWDGSPWTDIRVRKAANLAIDRAGKKSLLGGMMVEAHGRVPLTSDWFGPPEVEAGYDPEAARTLMAEAGFSKDNPVTVKAIISTSDGGQMQPLLMNELIQQNLAKIGINVEFDLRDWTAQLANGRAGAADPTTQRAVSTNSA